MHLREKFLAYADVEYAIILMSPDDVGNSKGEYETTANLHSRARQNVIFELGYFTAKLAMSRVCVLKAGDVEVPSDFAGVLYVPYDETGKWKFVLFQNLNGAGIAIPFERFQP